MTGVLGFPTNTKLRRLTPRASRQLRPSNTEQAPAGTPIRAGGPIKHVFYIVRENRTYDQMLGDDPRGDGDPKLTLFGDEHHAERARARPALPAARPRLRELGGLDRRPLLDLGGRRLRLRASRTGTRTTPAAGGPTTSASTRSPGPRSGFLFDAGREAGHLVLQLRRGGRRRRCRSPTRTATPDGERSRSRRSSPSRTSATLGRPASCRAPATCYPNDASIGKPTSITGQDGVRLVAARRRRRPARSRASSASSAASSSSSPAPCRRSTTSCSPNDHTEGTTPGAPHAAAR